MDIRIAKPALAGLALTSLAIISSCQDYEADWTLEEIEQQEFLKSGIFDFATSGDVTINIDYNAPGATNPVWIYTENPFDDEGDLKEDVNAEFAFFLEDGKFQGKMSLPTSASRLYVVTGGIGLPMILTADVVNGSVELNYNVNEGTRAEASDTLSYSDYTYIKATVYDRITCTNDNTGVYSTSGYTYDDFYKSLYALYTWNEYGTPSFGTSSVTTIWSGTKNDNWTDWKLGQSGSGVDITAFDNIAAGDVIRIYATNYDASWQINFSTSTGNLGVKDNGSNQYASWNGDNLSSGKIEITVTQSIADQLKNHSSSDYCLQITAGNVTFTKIEVTGSHTDKPYKNVNNDTLKGVISRLQNTLWHGTGSKSAAKDKYKDEFNKTFASNNSDENNITVTDENGASLYVTFLAEYCENSADVFGYYYYPEGQAPTKSTIKDYRKFIIFPNCSSDVYRNNSKKYYNGSSYSATPLKTGDQVQLMYYDETTGQYTPTFPKGTTVGWFLIYNGFDAWDKTNKKIGSGKVRIGASDNNNNSTISKLYYSDPQLNDDNQARCIEFTDAPTGIISLCFENSYDYTGHGSTKHQDWTYDDAIFTVSATPNSIRNNNGNITSTSNDQYINYTQEGIYAFEDIWNGNQTDFDMNDVAVKYNREYAIIQTEETTTIEGQWYQDGWGWHQGPSTTTITTTNKVASIREHYTLMNDGATYKDGFAIQLPYDPSIIDTIMCSKNGSVPDLMWLSQKMSLNQIQSTDASSDNNVRLEYGSTDGKFTVVLFDNINTMDMNTTYDVITIFKSDQRPSLTGTINESDKTQIDVTSFDYGRDAYNPFVIVYDADKEDGKRCEIHRPNYAPTQYGIVKGASNKDNVNNNRWYVAKLNDSDLYVPFALDIPDPSFVSPREGVVVTSAYTKFADWVLSGGTDFPDWYSNSDYKNTSNIGWERKE